MSEISGGLDISSGEKKVGPDYFGFYACEVAALLSQEEDFLPFSPLASDTGAINGMVGGKCTGKDSNNIKENNSISGSGALFSGSLGTRIPEPIKERLKSLLRQSVFALSQEVDEMQAPVFSICRIRAALRLKESRSNITNTACETDRDQLPQKKIKLSTPSSDSETKKMDISVSGKKMPDSVIKKCSVCSMTESESPCSACGYILEKQRESPHVSSDTGAYKENDGDDDFQFLLEGDSSEVEDILKKYSDELLTTIKHMENMLDKILDVIMLNCRSMSRIEKQELKKLIQNLPGSNLDRVVEIIQQRRPEEKISCGEMCVDLEKEDNVTLWRLYYYVKTVESFRKLRRTHGERDVEALVQKI